MRLIIPPQFQIGCRIFSIRINEKLLQELGYKAQLDDRADLIRLSKRSPQSMFESLIHEMLHEATYSCHQDSDDDNIQPLATFLAQALLSLGIEPDFSEVPE